jgi:predicted transcriptional regulator YheO
MFKNFSSLYAILYALQSKGILQLKNTVKEVSRGVHIFLQYV